MTRYACELPVRMRDDHPAIEAVITQRAYAAGYHVTPGADITVRLLTDALHPDRRALYAEVEATPLRASLHGVLHHPTCRFLIDGHLPTTAIPTIAAENGGPAPPMRRCGRCFPERPHQ